MQPHPLLLAACTCWAYIQLPSACVLEGQKTLDSIRLLSESGVFSFVVFSFSTAQLTVGQQCQPTCCAQVQHGAPACRAAGAPGEGCASRTSLIQSVRLRCRLTFPTGAGGKPTSATDSCSASDTCPLLCRSLSQPEPSAVSSSLLLPSSASSASDQPVMRALAYSSTAAARGCSLALSTAAARDSSSRSSTCMSAPCHCAVWEKPTVCGLAAPAQH